MIEETILDQTDGGIAGWSAELKCFVHSIGYEFSTNTGFIIMLTGGCTSMSGAIALFERINPDVWRIVTMYPTRPEPDTCYLKTEDGWQAIKSELPRPIRVEFQ